MKEEEAAEPKTAAAVETEEEEGDDIIAYKRKQLHSYTSKQAAPMRSLFISS